MCHCCALSPITSLCFPLVLKARAKQLQGNNIPEVTNNKVELAALDNDKYQEAVAPAPKEEQPIPRARGDGLAQSSTWAKKLQKEVYIQQLKMKQELPSAASQLALESQAKLEVKAETKAKPKAKTMTSPKFPKTKAATAWNQSSGSPHSKPRGVEVKEAKEQKRPQRMPNDKNNQQVLQQTIQSNLECFVFLQQSEEAERYLLLCQSSPMKKKVLDIGAYNTVMRSWARKVPSHGCSGWERGWLVRRSLQLVLPVVVTSASVQAVILARRTELP